MELNQKKDPQAMLSVYFQKREYEKVRDLSQKILIADSKSTVAINFLGLCSIEEGNYPQAEKYINQLVCLEPKNAVAFNNLGMAQYRLEKYPEALMNFTKAIHLAPQ